MARLDEIENELKELKEQVAYFKKILFGDTETNSKGECQKTKEMYDEFKFFSRIYKVFMFIISTAVVVIIGIVIKSLMK